jgi:hypothetical protein
MGLRTWALYMLHADAGAARAEHMEPDDTAFMAIVEHSFLEKDMRGAVEHRNVDRIALRNMVTWRVLASLARLGLFV